MIKKVAVAIDEPKVDIWTKAIKERGWKVGPPHRLMAGLLILRVEIDDSQLVELEGLLKRLQSEWVEAKRKKWKKRKR